MGNAHFRTLRTGLLVSLLASQTAVAATSCVKQSPAHTVALVELYTSEGCSSCPPADRWMSAIGRNGYSFDSVVPLALHVDYWDDIGWKDRFASGRFTGRQHRLTDLAGAKVVYTPEVFLGTRELRDWDSPTRFSNAVAAINAKPARASIRLELDPPVDGRIAVQANFRLADGVVADRAQAYIALYENRLSSDVRAGENSGVVLRHDHVVRQWIGPLNLAGGVAQVKHVLALPKDAVPRNLGVAALVQDEASRDVLQATALPACQA